MIYYNTPVVLFIAADILGTFKKVTNNYTEQIAGASTEKKMIATLKTSEGDITIKLSSETPKTSQNFVDLVKKGSYNETVFHRVIKGFMIQGGDIGNQAYNIPDEPFTGEYVRGTVAMANTGMPNSGGTQFFIMHGDKPVAKNYTIFGHVISGMDVVDKIATAPTDKTKMNALGEYSTPVNPVKIISAEVVE